MMKRPLYRALPVLALAISAASCSTERQQTSPAESVPTEVIDEATAVAEVKATANRMERLYLAGEFEEMIKVYAPKFLYADTGITDSLTRDSLYSLVMAMQDVYDMVDMKRNTPLGVELFDQNRKALVSFNTEYTIYFKHTKDTVVFNTVESAVMERLPEGWAITKSSISRDPGYYEYLYTQPVFGLKEDD